MHKQFMTRNEREHERLSDAQAGHDQRLTRCETKLESVKERLDEERYLRGGFV